MLPLHDNHVGTGRLIIETGRHGVVPPVNRALPFCDGVYFFGVVGIVNNDDVSALPRILTTHTRCNPITVPSILPTSLLILVLPQYPGFRLGAIIEVPVVPGGQDNISGFDTVPCGEALRIGIEEELLGRVLDPHPGLPHDADVQTFHASRRDVNEKS